MRNRKQMSGRPFVVVENGELLLYTSKGELVEYNVFVRLHEEVNTVPTAVCKFVVNVAGSKEEMMKIIEELKAK